MGPDPNLQGFGANVRGIVNVVTRIEHIQTQQMVRVIGSGRTATTSPVESSNLSRRACPCAGKLKPVLSGATFRIRTRRSSQAQVRRTFNRHDQGNG
jgi:hypothetical protein